MCHPHFESVDGPMEESELGVTPGARPHLPVLTRCKAPSAVADPVQGPICRF